MEKPIGKMRWAIPNGFIQDERKSDDGKESHDMLSILNTNPDDAHVHISFYFTDRDPAGPYDVIVPGKRTKYIQLHKLNDPMPIPKEKEFSTVVESSLPVVVQFSRIDPLHIEKSVLSTMAFGSD
jgi:hypothetical protein